MSWPAVAAVVALHLATPAGASSTASSLALEASSAALGSVSDSLQSSSRSSAGDPRVAEGDYRVVDVAEDGTRPQHLRLTLAPLEDREGATALTLWLPRVTRDAQGLEVGDVVGARERPYGLAFVRTPSQQPFFLVLHDAAWRERQTRVVPFPS